MAIKKGVFQILRGSGYIGTRKKCGPSCECAKCSTQQQNILPANLRQGDSNEAPLLPPGVKARTGGDRSLVTQREDESVLLPTSVYQALREKEISKRDTSTKVVSDTEEPLLPSWVG